MCFDDSSLTLVVAMVTVVQYFNIAFITDMYTCTSGPGDITDFTVFCCHVCSREYKVRKTLCFSLMLSYLSQWKKQVHNVNIRSRQEKCWTKSNSIKEFAQCLLLCSIYLKFSKLLPFLRSIIIKTKNCSFKSFWNQRNSQNGQK